MSKRFLWLVLLLGMFQDGFGADIDDVDDDVSTNQVDEADLAGNMQRFYHGLAVTTIEDTLRNKIAALTVGIERLEAQDPDDDPDRAYGYQKELGGLRKEIAVVENATTKKKFEESIKNLLMRVQKLLPKKDKKDKKQPVQEALVVVAPLPKDLPMYPAQVAFSHQGPRIQSCLRGLFTTFPKGLSPERGHILIANTKIQQEMKRVTLKAEQNQELLPQEKLIFSLFKLTPEGALSVSTLPSNPVLAVSPVLLAQLIRMIFADQLLTVGRKGDFFDSWKKAYEELRIDGKTIGNFKSNAAHFLKTVHECVLDNKQEAIDSLLAYFYARFYVTTDPAAWVAAVVAFAYELGFTYTPAYFTVADVQECKWKISRADFSKQPIDEWLEALLFLINRPKDEVGLLTLLFYSSDRYATYAGVSYPACMENTMRTLLNLILCNVHTKSLDRTRFSGEKEVSQELQLFVERFGNLRQVNPDQAEKAYLDLVQNRPGIAYSRKNGAIRFELQPTIQNAMALLALLFKKSYTANAALSREALQKQFVEMVQELMDPSVKFTVAWGPLREGRPDVHEGRFVIRGSLDVEGILLFCSGHAGIVFTSTDVNSIDFNSLRKPLLLANEALGECLVGLVEVSPFAFLADGMSSGAFTSQEQILTFINSYASPFYPSFKTMLLNAGQHEYGLLFDQDNYKRARKNPVAESYKNLFLSLISLGISKEKVALIRKMLFDNRDFQMFKITVTPKTRILSSRVIELMEWLLNSQLPPEVQEDILRGVLENSFHGMSQHILKKLSLDGAYKEWMIPLLLKAAGNKIAESVDKNKKMTTQDVRLALLDQAFENYWMDVISTIMHLDFKENLVIPHESVARYIGLLATEYENFPQEAIRNRNLWFRVRDDVAYMLFNNDQRKEVVMQAIARNNYSHLASVIIGRGYTNSYERLEKFYEYGLLIDSDEPVSEDYSLIAELALQKNVENFDFNRELWNGSYLSDAFSHSNASLFKRLLERGAVPSKKTLQRMSYYFDNMTDQQKEMLEEVLKDQRNREKIVWAVVGDHIGGPERIAFLKERGIDFTLKNQDGNSALMVALLSFSPKMFKMLVEQDANLTVSNNEGKDVYALIDVLLARGVESREMSREANKDRLNTYAQVPALLECIEILRALPEDKVNQEHKDQLEKQKKKLTELIVKK